MTATRYEWGEARAEAARKYTLPRHTPILSVGTCETTESHSGAASGHATLLSLRQCRFANTFIPVPTAHTGKLSDENMYAMNIYYYLRYYFHSPFSEI